MNEPNRLLEVTHATCRMPKVTVQTDEPLRLPSLFRRTDKHPETREMKTIFTDLSFSLSSGDIVDLVGPSGSGKSTLLTTIAQLNPHASADLTLAGAPASRMSPERWRREVAYLPQRPTLTGATVREAILMPFSLRVHRVADDGSSLEERRPDEATLRRTLDNVGCSDIELERSPQDLSVGQQARVCLLRTLLTLPKVMLADEVDAGLDEENADKVGEILAYAAREKGMAIVRVRHRAADGRATRTLHLEAGVLTEITGQVAAAPAHEGGRTEGEATR
ncbi:ATP-binding cassette domain-containing protein [Bifidobacterium amazonense]|uniref:ATP-binding cassette domain-containing protein n=1 Tax=Bifidobacterium amazonense TaxID=2809027 RepID=A0ABS9VU94_9BIFI|nr:ATP-binding cassette domain-containing protein [Bifidobacterium amazonense]MCH9275509.1 ATP-binding cassette domain-containing protein [Bifidobacterium amazonense]